MNKNEYKEELKAAIQDFKNSFNRLVELFGDADNDANDYICDEYPFDKSFDELAVDAWADATCANLHQDEKSLTIEYTENTTGKRFVEFDADVNAGDAAVRIWCCDDSSGDSDRCISRTVLNKEFTEINRYMEEQ